MLRLPDAVASHILARVPLERCLSAGLACRWLLGCAAEPRALLCAARTIVRFWRWCAGRVGRLVLSLGAVYAAGNGMSEEAASGVWRVLARRVRTLRGRLRGLGGEGALARFDAGMHARYGW